MPVGWKHYPSVGRWLKIYLGKGYGIVTGYDSGRNSVEIWIVPEGTTDVNQRGRLLLEKTVDSVREGKKFSDEWFGLID